MLKRYSLKFTLFLVFSDLLLFELAQLLSVYLRDTLPYGKTVEEYSIPSALHIIYPLLTAIVFRFLRTYTPEKSLRIMDEIPVIITATSVAWFGYIGILYLTFRDVSRLQNIYLLLLTIILIGSHRLLLRAYFRLTGGRKFDLENVLIVGDDEIARQAAEAVLENAWAGFYLMGFVSETRPVNAIIYCDRPVLGDLEQIGNIIGDYAIDEVIVTSNLDSQPRLTFFIQQLYAYPVNVRIVPDITSLLFLRASVENLGNLPLITLREPILSPSQRIIKRVFDLVFGSIFAIIALPLLLIISILIKLDSVGPILFSQERIGEGGKTFKMVKFRTMVNNADEKWQEVAKYDEMGNLVHKTPDDPRVTRIGHFLRRTSLDELPQLFNILKGDMSLVGPRPELPRMVDRYQEWQRKRFEVPQGLTGWWQVTRESESLMHLHTEDDLFYIRNYSTFLDMQIILRTILAILTGKGAY